MARRPHLRPLLKIDIERAQASTKSAAQAARLLHLSFKTYKKYALLYNIHKTNQRGIGIPRNKEGMPFSLNRILAGEYPHYEHRRLKVRLVNAGILPNECAACGFKGARPDGRVPLILYNKDGNPKNLVLGNIELRCFNCIYLTTGKMMEKAIERMSSGTYNADFKEQIMLSDREIEEMQNEVLDNTNDDWKD
jgi:hypothetical protein